MYYRILHCLDIASIDKFDPNQLCKHDKKPTQIYKVTRNTYAQIECTRHYNLRYKFTNPSVLYAITYTLWTLRIIRSRSDQ